MVTSAAELHDNDLIIRYSVRRTVKKKKDHQYISNYVLGHFLNMISANWSDGSGKLKL